jgi:hypothetical protein
MDLRVTSGWFFLLLGGILIAVSIVAPSYRAPLTQANVNLYAGSTMALFGGILLWIARRYS